MLSRLTGPDAPGATAPGSVPREVWPSAERYICEEEKTCHWSRCSCWTEHAVCSKADPYLVIYGSPLASKKPPRNLGFQRVLPELPIRIELMTFSLRVKRSTD